MSDRPIDKLVKEIFADDKPKLKLIRPRDKNGKFARGEYKVVEQSLKDELKEKLNG